MRISDWSSDVCSSDLLGEGGHVGQRRHALGGADGQAAHLALFDERQRRRHLVEIEIHLPAQQVGGGGRVALVVHGGPARARHRLQQFADQVVGGAGARRGHVELARVFLGQGQQEIGSASCRERVCQYV